MTTRIFVRSLLASAVVLGAPTVAMAADDFSAELAIVTDQGGGDFTFVQAGFSDGAEVTGSFSGVDLDGNGQLSTFESELTAFEMSFSGNRLVDGFSLGLDDLFGAWCSISMATLATVSISTSKVSRRPPAASFMPWGPGHSSRAMAEFAVSSRRPNRRRWRCSVLDCWASVSSVAEWPDTAADPLSGSLS